ncbi:porin family protein [Neolewinella sp.]|uniref:porin family protein n=1 Tax=Neolewinella sp. TaxID=2993543 RepID=UPI003B51F6E1
MKPYLLLPLAFVFSLTAAAQINPIQLGIQLSPTFNYLTTDNNLIESDGTKLGLKLGLIAEYYFQDNYSIHTGINFHFGAGGALRYDDQFTQVNIWSEPLNEVLTTQPTPGQLTGGSTYDYNLQFVEIPLGLTLRTREFGYLRYFVQPAFTLGIVASSKGSIERASYIDDNESFKIGSEVNALNLSWGIGGGVEYSISTQTSLIGGLGFQSGFLDLTTDNDTQVTRPGRDPAEDDSKGRQQSIIIMLGVLF